MQRIKFSFLKFMVAAFLLTSPCQLPGQKVVTAEATSRVSLMRALVPRPMKMTGATGQFSLVPSTVILWQGSGAEGIASYLKERLRPATGFSLAVKTQEKGKNHDNAILLQVIPGKESSLGTEGYELVVARNGQVLITAAKPAGLFYGCQTYCQLLPPAIDSPQFVPNTKWTGPRVSIVDVPRFQWRGLMLDTCRHFSSTATVKRYIDLLSRHKMNRFHWHLTEDQGWRIEVPGYPLLSTVSSKRKETPIPADRKQGDGRPHGGLFTSTEIKEVVAYAAERFVTVIPEIEMPGHSLAALAAYPELACTEGPFEVGTKWGVFRDVYCAGNEKTFEFLEDVLKHVFTLFPGEFVHIGGDECPKTRWKKCPQCQARIKEEGLKNEHELQSYFISRMEKFLNANGKRLVGWDEILEGGLPANATVMSWRGIKGGIAAAKSGHDVVMTPTSHCYFDYYQGKDRKAEPPAIGGFLPCKKVYLYEPIPHELTAKEAEHILGAQGNLWTEYVPNQDQADYMVYPRASALAERLWSPKECRDWDEFRKRLEVHLKRLELLGVAYRPLDDA